MTLEEYGDHMNEVEATFEQAAESELGPQAEFEDSEFFPVGGDLVPATILFRLMEERLDGWKAASPPGDIAALHDTLVEKMDIVQTQVSRYLADESLATDDFDLASIGAELRVELAEATGACRDLRAGLSAFGIEVAFADSCNI